MAAARTVQARSRETVIEMYEAAKIPSFGIYSGNDLLYGMMPETMDEGVQLLDQWLDWIDQSKSSAIYSLRLYRGITDEEQINNKQKYNGCINFRLHELSQAIGGAEGNRGFMAELAGVISGLRDEVKELRDRMDEKEEEADNGGDMGLGVVGKVLSDPQLVQNLPMIIGMVKELFSAKPAQQEIPPTQKLSGVTAVKTEEEVIQDAISRLRVHVPDLPEVLAKLAVMAEKKPFNLKMALVVIRTMKL
jgi:hypothetical protein